jgi:dihydroorotase
MANFDVVLKGGRVLDPAQGIDAPVDIGIKHGRISALEADLPADDAWLVLDVTDHYVTPGLIDLHTHIYWGGTDLGVLPDPLCLASGVTTAVDAGSAGWANFTGFRHYVMGQARTRTFAFLNIASIGITDMRVGENLNLAYCGVEDAIKAVEANRDVVLGVKVRVAEKICGPNGLEPLRRAAAVRDATDTRMMVHISDCEQPVQEILDYLRPGDIVTHCFTGRGRLILDQQTRKVHPEVRAAQQNGIAFDVGHGQGSFSFTVARDALADGFLPDTISTDLHNYSSHFTAKSLPDVMSKFLFLGRDVPDVVARATQNAAAAIGRADSLGHLRIGGVADVAALRLVSGPYPMLDAEEEEFTGDQHLEASYTVRAGEVFNQAGQAARRWYGPRPDEG